MKYPGRVRSPLCHLFVYWWYSPYPPAVGEFLMAKRGRTAFEIVEVRESRSAKYRLGCLRWNPKDIPRRAAVREWVWSPRHRITPVARRLKRPRTVPT